MRHPAESRSNRPPARKNPLRTVALLLLGLAVLLSAWLVHLSLASGPVAGCDAGNCGVVLGSKWAKVFGVPVGLFGGASYLVLALLGARPIPAAQRGARIAAASLALLIPAAALWFVALQIFVIKAFCAWCCTTHALATLGAIGLIFAWRTDRPASSSSSSSSRRSDRHPPTAPIWGAALASTTVAFAGFLLAQVLSPEPPKAQVITASMSSPSPSSTQGSPSNTTGTTTAPIALAGSSNTNATAAAPTQTTPPPATPTPAPAKRLVLHGGQFQLDPHDYPCNGSPDAEHVMLMISDYTCQHCRAAYKILKEIRESFDGRRLGIVMLPSHHGGDSLELQELLLAAWKLEPEIWAEIGSDLYLERLPLRPDLVRNTLSQRLGPGRLEGSREANRAWTKSMFDLARAIHGANKSKTGSGSIPQFIMGEKIVVGSPVDAADLFRLLQENLGLVRDRLPVLALSQPTYDLGKLFAGTGPTLRVIYTNTGNAPLQLSRATVPHGGRVLRGLQVPVPSGQTGMLELALSVPRDPGPFEQDITLFSNARNAEEKVGVKAESWKPVRIDPALLDLGKIDPDSPQLPEGTMRVELEEDAALESVRSQNPGFEVTLREVTPNRAYDLVVRPTRSLPTGVQQTALLVSLRKPVPPGWPETLAFAARAQVERPVVVIPPRVYVPEGTLPAERHHQVLVRCTDGSPEFTVTGGVLDGGPAFAVPDIQRGGRSNEFLVRFTLPAGWSLPLAPVEARLRLQTTHPKMPVVEVPLVPQTR